MPHYSLSIEGFRVSPELIERVMSGKWEPVGLSADAFANDDKMSLQGRR